MITDATSVKSPLSKTKDIIAKYAKTTIYVNFATKHDQRDISIKIINL